MYKSGAHLVELNLGNIRWLDCDGLGSKIFSTEVGRPMFILDVERTRIRSYLSRRKSC